MKLYFSALHQSLENQYAPCDCEACRNSPTLGVSITLSENNNPFRKVLEAGAAAFKKMFERQSYKPADLFTVPEYRTLMDETKAAFDFGIKHHVPESLKSYLDRDVFIFSGLKTHQQLADARSYLKDEKGNIRPYHEFEKRMLKLNPQYNKNYLDAEYSFAVQSAISASAWESFDGGEEYYLQYRTAGDERVRASHATLHNTTLPKDDEFWDSYMPPNGWRCRCRAIEVAAYNYAKTDSKTAIKAGEKATTQYSKSGKNSLEMFRFNPGKAKQIFPKNNAYNPRHCDGGKVNLSGLIGHSQIVLALENERCQAKKIIEDKALGNKISEKQAVYKLPFNEQFYKHNDGYFVHKLYSAGSDHDDLVNAALHFISKNKTPYILPEIHKSEKEARTKIFPKYENESSNPDLWIKEDKEFWEVENSLGNNIRNVRQRIKSGLAQADNVYLYLQDDKFLKYAEQQLQNANKFYIKIKKTNP